MRVKLGLWVSVDGHVLVIFQAGLRVYDSGLGAWAFDMCSKGVWFRVSEFKRRGGFEK